MNRQTPCDHERILGRNDVHKTRACAHNRTGRIDGEVHDNSIHRRPQLFVGKIVTTDARLSDSNRMIMVRAEIPNPDKKLVPGMYANVTVDAGTPETVVTVPQTAVTYSLYGDNVFVVNATKVKDKDGKDVDELVIERRFVKTGPVRDGRVSIVSGIKDGDKVVTAGQNKIDQGSKVVIDNSIALKRQDTSTIQ